MKKKFAFTVICNDFLSNIGESEEIAHLRPSSVASSVWIGIGRQRLVAAVVEHMRPFPSPGPPQPWREQTDERTIWQQFDAEIKRASLLSCPDREVKWLGCLCSWMWCPVGPVGPGSIGGVKEMQRQLWYGLTVYRHIALACTVLK